VTKILIAWLATTSIFAASFKFEVYRSDKKNVFNMGYRLTNRILQKEKKNTERICANKLSEYALTSLTLDKNYKFQMDLIDHGIKVGQGKRSTIEFACELSISGEFDQTLVEQETLKSRKEAIQYCQSRVETLQQESEDLIIGDIQKTECRLFAL